MIFGKTEDAMFAISSVNPFCSKRHIHIIYIYINTLVCELILFPFLAYQKKEDQAIEIKEYLYIPIY